MAYNMLVERTIRHTYRVFCCFCCVWTSLVQSCKALQTTFIKRNRFCCHWITRNASASCNFLIVGKIQVNFNNNCGHSAYIQGVLLLLLCLNVTSTIIWSLTNSSDQKKTLLLSLINNKSCYYMSLIKT